MQPLLKFIPLLMLNFCVTWTVFAQDSILITDDEYRTFRIAQEQLKECNTIADLHEQQYQSATNTISLKDIQIKGEQQKYILAGQATETVHQELLLSQSETKVYKKEVRKWKFYTFSIGIASIIATSYLLVHH